MRHIIRGVFSDSLKRENASYANLGAVVSQMLYCLREAIGNLA